MSVNRRLKRDKYLSEKVKPPVKFTFREIVLVTGIVTLCFGIFYGIYNYNVYTSGQSEHTTESRGGSIYYPEENPGDPGRKESVNAGWKIAGFGILLMILSMVLCIINKVLDGTIEKFKERTGGKQCLGKRN